MRKDLSVLAISFFERYCGLCLNQGSTPNGVAKKLGIARASVAQWKLDPVPRMEPLAKITDYFGVTAYYLAGKAPKEKAPARWQALKASAKSF